MVVVKIQLQQKTKKKRETGITQKVIENMQMIDQVILHQVQLHHGLTTQVMSQSLVSEDVYHFISLVKVYK